MTSGNDEGTDNHEVEESELSQGPELNTEKVPVPEPITVADKHRVVSQADFKMWRNRTIIDLNRILSKFQQDQVQAQSKLNLIWNAINAVIRAFMKKSVPTGVTLPKDLEARVSFAVLLSEMDIREAGEELMREAMQNMEQARDAVAVKQQVQPGRLHKAPLETFQKILSDAHTAAKKEKGE